MAAPDAAALANALLSGGSTTSRPPAAVPAASSRGGTPDAAALANALLGSSSSTSSSGTAPAAAPAKHGGGILADIGGTLRGIGVGTANLFTDAAHSLTHDSPGGWHGVLQQWEHPLRPVPGDPLAADIQGMARSEGATWGPLVEHGDVSGIAKNPVGAALDAYTLLSLGAGGLARAGALADKAGLIGADSRLATLGHPAALTVPDLAKQLGQPGADVLRKVSAGNPLIKARQVGVNKLLNAAPAGIPLVGSEARLARTVAKGAAGAGQSLALKAAPLEAAFNRLNKTERAVWHLRMQHLDPQGWQDLLAEGAVKEPTGTEAAMSAKLSNPKLNALYRDPAGSKNLLRALTIGHQTADLLSAAKVEGGFLDPLAAAERPYLAQRVLHGATFVPETASRLGKVSPRLAAMSAYVDRLTGLHGRALDRITNAPLEKQFSLAQRKQIGEIVPPSDREFDIQGQLDHLNKKLTLLRKRLPVDSPEIDALVKQKTSWQKLNLLRRDTENLATQYSEHGGALGLETGAAIPGEEEIAARIEALRAEINDARGPRDDVLWKQINALETELRALRKERKALNVPASRQLPSGVVLTKEGARLEPRGYQRAQNLGAALSVARDRLAQLEAARAARITPTGLVGGPTAPELAQRLDEQNAELPDELRQPSYVPHSATSGKKPWQSYRPGANPPLRAGSSRQNEAVLLRKGMLNLHKNSLAEELRNHARIVQRTDTHAALMQVAAKEPEGGLPAGYRFLKTRSLEPSAPHTEQVAGALKQELAGKPSLLERAKGGSLSDLFTTREHDLPEGEYAKDAEGHRLIIPDHVANLLSLEARPNRSLLQHILYNRPTTVWKHLVLGLRPAYMVNIILSQHILGALQMAGGTRGVTAYFNHLLPGARLGKLSDRAVEDTMPEQASASFSHSTGTGGAKGVAATAYQGVMPATMKVENWLRRLMIEGWAKSSPQIRRAMDANGGSIDEAMRSVAQSDPHVLHEISQRVDDAQGNYRTYSPAEEKLRQVIPFYGWDRHIIQSTYRLLAERPALANFGYKVGQQGEQQNLALFGKLPPYLQGIVALGDLPHFLSSIGSGTPGTTRPVLASKAFEPFSTVADIGSLADALVHGQPGAGNEQLANINPLITGTLSQLTGKNLQTGAPLKGNIPGGVIGNVFLRTAADLPQARLLEQELGWHPTGQSKRPVSSRDVLTQLLALAGVPVKKLDVPEANTLATAKPR